MRNWRGCPPDTRHKICKGCVNHEMPPFTLCQWDIVTKVKVARCATLGYGMKPRCGIGIGIKQLSERITLQREQQVKIPMNGI